MILFDTFGDEMTLEIGLDGTLELEPSCGFHAFNKEQVEELRDYLTALLDNGKLQ